MLTLRFSTVLALLVFLLAVGCDSNTYRSYRGHVVEIKYSRGDTLQAGQWLKIDGHKFTHLQDARKRGTVDYYLPTSYTVVDSSDTRAYGTEVQPIEMSLHLAQQLGFLNEDLARRGGNQPRYDAGPAPLVRLKGTVQLSKSNSELVQVQVPYGYPAKVRVLK